MLDIIQNNPYHLLDIYSKLPAKERAANHNKLKTSKKVGKDGSYLLDLLSINPLIVRSDENISEACAKLTLSNDKLMYAQFWFMKVTILNDIAMNHLIAGSMKKAIHYNANVKLRFKEKYLS